MTWDTRRLRDVVDLRRGMDLPHHARRDGPYPVLTAGAIAGRHSVGPVKGPGLAIGRATNLGRPTWSDSDFWPLNTTLYVAKFYGNEPRWVYHLFESLDLSGYDSGSVQPMLNRNYIADVSVMVPSIREQRAITEVLGSLDAKIATNRRVVAVSEELMLTAASSFPAMVPLAQIAAYSRQLIDPSTLGETIVAHFSLPAFDAKNGPEHVAASAIMSGKFAVDEPSVLVSKLNPRFPRMWDVSTLPPEQALASTEFVVLRPAHCSTTVLWSLLQQPAFVAALEGMAAGTSGSHQRVKQAEILATLVADPRTISVHEQGRITAIGARAHAARRESLTLSAIRDTVLPALMAGRLRVRDAQQLVDDAP